ncbi:MAG: 1-acyl-sn-glycerol-3-phosphate acyltransferase, partial [Acetobacteraceae bacterium]|nr:1-acyl-sn-glycerol-3-phosphate acyltransferase [Acetobacteraceae bacterium]
IVSALTGRPQPLLFARLVISYLGRELAVLLTCGGLWLVTGFGIGIRSRRSQLLHLRLLRWFVHGIAQRVITLLRIQIESGSSPEATTALRGDRPLLFFSRHAGPGDTVMLVDQLLSEYDRAPSVVFKQTLAIDPCVDLIGHRMPHAVLDTSNAEECEAQIAEVAAGLGPRGVLVLFPEGGNFTKERRRHALRSLRRRGRRREAAAGERMTHMLPPHPTGALAALRGNPDADIVFAAHTGLGLAAFPRELWRDTPIGRTLKTRMWLVPATDRPEGQAAQTQWLYHWWQHLDAWVDSQGEEEPGEQRTAG